MVKTEYHLKKDEQYQGLNIEKKMTRDAFARTLVRLAKEDERIVALSADLMYPTKLDIFAKQYPDRFFNLGVAEQDMMGVAAGLATCGKIPFVATFAVFATTRACEQIRTDIAYPKLNVKIVGTAGGFSFGMGGVTHASTEDIAIMRSIANMTVVVPADAMETEKAVESAVKYNGPLYIRIGRGAEPVIYKEDYQFEIGKSVTLREGRDITIISTGSMVFEALRAAEELSRDNIEARVINFHTIKPLDREAILKTARETKAIISVEEHTIIGGLGSAVSEVLAEAEIKTRFRRIGLPDIFAIPGHPDELRQKYGMNSIHIVSMARKLLSEE